MRKRSPWFKYVDDTTIKIQANEVEAFTKHKFTKEFVDVNKLSLLDFSVYRGKR